MGIWIYVHWDMDSLICEASLMRIVRGALGMALTLSVRIMEFQHRSIIFHTSKA